MAESSTLLPDRDLLPEHIGIIMDGNGRWAKQRGLPAAPGIKRAETFEHIVGACREFGISHLTVYAFSTENWKRPREEVAAIMDLLRSYLKRAENYKKENVQLHFLGDKGPLDKDLQEMIARAEEESRTNDGFYVNIALNYGGRDELVHAVRVLAERVKEGRLKPEQIDETMIGSFLYTSGQPDPDLIIRPSGEQRLSNFLIWQSAYAEFVFMDVLWPDFTKEHLKEAIWTYARRNRRFGGL